MTEEIGNSELLRTWANGGTVVVPPNAKIDEGWLRGEQPPHEWMNYIHNALGQKLNHALSRGTADWNADTLYLVGSLARHDGRVWMSFVENSNSEPSSANSDWSVVQDERSSVTTEDILVEVGAGGDFPTISAAIEELSRLRRGWSATAKTAEIRLRAGFVMEESVRAIAFDLGWLRITGVDSVTSIARSAIPGIEGVGPEESWPAFLAFAGGRLPVIAQMFEMDTTGSALSRDGISVSDGSARIEAGCGVSNAGRRGLQISGGEVFAEGAVFDGAGSLCINVTRSSNLSFRGGSAKNGLERNATVWRGSRADLGDADLSGAVLDGLFVREGGFVNARSANCRRGGADSSTDMLVENGGVISALDSTGGTNVTPNTVTSAGIIFK